jgi:predicted DNA-binding transcriptional regulator AlpA
MEKPSFADDWLITGNDARNLVKLKRTAFHDAVAAGRLPQPVYLSKRAPRWRWSEMRELIQNGPRPGGYK